MEFEEPVSDSQFETVLNRIVEKLTLTKKHFLLNFYQTQTTNDIQLNEMSPQDEVEEAEVDEDKSVSTEVSIFDIIGDLQTKEDKPDQLSDKKEYNMQYSVYQRKISK